MLFPTAIFFTDANDPITPSAAKSEQLGHILASRKSYAITGRAEPSQGREFKMSRWWVVTGNLKRQRKMRKYWRRSQCRILSMQLKVVLKIYQSYQRQTQIEFVCFSLDFFLFFLFLIYIYIK